MSSWIENALLELKSQLEDEVNHSASDVHQRARDTLTVVNRLLEQGDVLGAEVALRDFYETLHGVASSLAGSLEESFEDVRDRIREEVSTRVRTAITSYLIGSLGPVGGVAAQFIIEKLEDLIRGYKLIDIQEYATMSNKGVLETVIKTSAHTHQFNEANHGDGEAMREYYQEILPGRDAVAAEVLGSPLLNHRAKWAVFQYQRQQHFLTPGQRNLLQGAADKLYSLHLRSHGNSNATASAAASDFMGLLSGGTSSTASPAPVTHASLASEFAPEIVKGLAARHQDVWGSWFPGDFGPATHLGVELHDLLPGEVRERFLALIA